jgi:hypothetical protein
MVSLHSRLHLTNDSIEPKLFILYPEQQMSVAI